MRTPSLVALLLALLVLPAPAQAAKRCKWRDIPEPYEVVEPIHPALTNALGVLRREPRPEDALGEELKFTADVHKVSPSTLRQIAVVRGTRFWVMGATVGLDRMHARCRRLLPPAARRREARWFRRMKARPLGLAILWDDPEGGSGGGFLGRVGNAADLFAGRMETWTDVDEQRSPTLVAVGLVPDGVASVGLTYVARNDATHMYGVPVHENAYVVELDRDVVRRERISWYDAEGRAIRSFGRG